MATTRPKARPASRLHRLETRLAAVGEVREKRSRQLERARTRNASGKRAAKRERQLLRADRMAAALLLKIAGLAAPVVEGPTAYCLSERMSVQMRDPQPFVMRNGRLATAGVCPSCGKRVTRAG